MAFNPQRIVVPIVRQIVARPRLADVLFRFDPWGNPFPEERYSDPYPLLKEWRKQGELVHKPTYQSWFALGYSEIQQLLNHPNVDSSSGIEAMLEVRPYNRLKPETTAFYLNWMLLKDGDDHGRLRKLVARAFTPRRIAELESSVEKVAHDLVRDARDRADASGSVDVAREVNERLPINVIATMLGLPEDQWDWMLDTAQILTLFLNPFEAFDPAEIDVAVAEFRNRILALADERRRQPQNDLLSVLVEAADDGDRLTDDELLANAGLLLFAGFETTASMLGNAQILLAKHPDQRALVRSQPELWTNAVEELLRFDSPVAMTQRFATGDIDIAGQTIKAGTQLTLFIQAGNRDPRRWDNPDELRLDREDPRPISFGHGLHHCLGHALARTELRVGLRAFIDAFGDYTVDESSIVWRRNLATKGPTRLRITPG